MTLDGLGRLSRSTLTISMYDQRSSTVAKKSQKKDGGIVKRIRDLIKRPKPANDSDSAVSASQSNSASVSFAYGSQVSENDARGADTTASRSIHLSVINDDLASPNGNAALNQGMSSITRRSNVFSPLSRSYHLRPVRRTSLTKRSGSAEFHRESR